MSKAILVIDMPKCCGECKLYMNNGNSYWCIVTGKDTTGFTIPASCPLKPMQKKQGISLKEAIGIKCSCYSDGWNDCIDELEGEEQ